MFGQPNITGDFNNSYAFLGGTFISPNGCFYGAGNGRVLRLADLASDPDTGDVYKIILDAHRCNTIYNSGASITPKSLIFNHAIKS